MRHPDKLQPKAKTHVVTRQGAATWQVISGYTGESYTVTQAPEGGYICSCPWAKYRPVDDPRTGCTHVIAVIAREQAEQARTVRAWADPTQAARQHRHQVDIGDGLILTTRKAGS
jgi:predicted nucleic acid-binding Zn finger protein